LVFGSYTFTGTFSGNAYADFLLGIPQQSVRTTPQPRQYSRNHVYAGYIQDSWRVTPNLTVNLGLRYEYETPFNEINGQMYNFDPATGNIVLPTQAALKNVSPLFPKSIGIETAQQAGFPAQGLCSGDNKDFGPRAGVAWRPFGKTNSVIRAAYGVYTNVLSAGQSRL